MISLQHSDASEAVNILVDAFDSDPLMKWLSDKPGFLEFFFSLSVPLFSQSGVCYFDDGKKGVALWTPPGVRPSLPSTLSNAIGFCKAGGVGSLLRFDRMQRKMERHDPPYPHYYLAYIGVCTEGKGMGLGSSLVSHILKECDERQFSAYLESSNPNNLSFYEKLGFNVMQEVELEAGGPSLWPMLRTPVIK